MNYPDTIRENKAQLSTLLTGKEHRAYVGVIKGKLIHLIEVSTPSPRKSYPEMSYYIARDDRKGYRAYEASTGGSSSNGDYKKYGLKETTSTCSYEVYIDPKYGMLLTDGSNFCPLELETGGLPDHEVILTPDNVYTISKVSMIGIDRYFVMLSDVGSYGQAAFVVDSGAKTSTKVELTRYNVFRDGGSMDIEFTHEEFGAKTTYSIHYESPFKDPAGSGQITLPGAASRPLANYAESKGILELVIPAIPKQFQILDNRGRDGWTPNHLNP